MKQFLILLFFLSFTAIADAQKNDAPLSPNAPHDASFSADSTKLRETDSLIAPYVAEARESLPAAKERFLKGLKQGEAFFLVIRIFDHYGKFEQVFIRIKDWDKDSIDGTIANDLNVVSGYRYGQLVYFTEKDILDWLISEPDGTEQGNVVGKFLDTQH